MGQNFAIGFFLVILKKNILIMFDSDQEKIHLFGFSLLAGIGPVRLEKIRTFFPDLKAAWQCRDVSLFEQAGIDPKTAQKVIQQKNQIRLEEEWQKQILQESLEIIWPDHPDYPPLLKEIASAPFILFCKGNRKILKNPQLAVVGSRRATFYGRQVLEKILTPLVRSGLTVTSGMAQGIDSLAHQIALEENSPTIAVLGSGLGQKILRKHPCFSLAEKILQKDGLILSELSPFQEANKATFPARNRIVAGLALGTLVVEAGEKSGSLITANQALENGREVFAVPNNIFQPMSIGANNLIKQGAKAATSANDILEAFNFSTLDETVARTKAEPLQFEDELEKKIFSRLTLEPQYLDKIANFCHASPSEISAKISLMEIKGLARNVGGGRFIRGIN